MYLEDVITLIWAAMIPKEYFYQIVIFIRAIQYN